MHPEDLPLYEAERFAEQLDGRTSLFAAAKSGELRVVNMLLAPGAIRVLDRMPQGAHLA